MVIIKYTKILWDRIIFFSGGGGDKFPSMCIYLSGVGTWSPRGKIQIYLED